MAYSQSGVSLAWQLLGGKYSAWVYRSTDAFVGTVNGADYFTNAGSNYAGSPGMKLYDLVICEKTDTASVVWAYVSNVAATTGHVTVTAMAFAGAATFTDLTATGNVNLGDAAADLLGFHGATAVSQRAGSNQASSNVTTSASFGTLQVAQINEIQNCLAQVGLWKGSA